MYYVPIVQYNQLFFIVIASKKSEYDQEIAQSIVTRHSCIDVYSYSCLHPLSNERNQEIHVLFEHGSALENT